MTALSKEELLSLSNKLYESLEIRERTYHLKKYPQCFTGTEAVKLLQQLHPIEIKSVTDAETIGKRMMDDYKLFYHVAREKSFCNKDYFYRFVRDDDLGSAKNVFSKYGESCKGGESVRNTDFESTFRANDDDRVNVNAWKLSEELEVSPLDEHNVKLLDNVHPRDWVNPKETDSYTLIVIGAGAGGLVTAAGSAGIGAKVCIIEEHLMGGDCLNVGCVPSKALIRAARAMKDAQNAKQFGVNLSSPPSIDFGVVMERMRKIRADISNNDSCERFSRDLGVAVYQGFATFVGSNKVEVAGKTLTFKKAVVATGASPAVPPIDGLREAPFLTNLTIFNLTELPPRLCVIGAGPIGLELAQAMARFGSKVTVFVRGKELLPKEDRDAAVIVQESLIDDGVNILFNVEFESISVSETTGTDNKYAAPWNMLGVHIIQNGHKKDFFCDCLLIATGRAPNVDLGLEKAGIEYDTKRGVHINQYLQTTNKNVYAVGDVCTKFQFTHMADFMARTVIRNALFFGSGKHSALLVPWATYTEPEIAHVGLYESDLKSRYIDFDTYTKHFADVDRAICDGEVTGFVKIHCKKGSDDILGATIVNANAGNMISEITLAMQMNIGLGSLAYVIHPYPTQSEAIRMCGDLYNKTRLTSTTKGLLTRVANRSLT